MSTVSDVAFPRTSTVRDLVHTIRNQPKLAKDANSALVDIGQAMQENATREETGELLRGTLYQEVYVRTSCLQTLQVKTFCPPFMKYIENNELAVRPHRLRLVSGAMDCMP